jgi:hypothetical protein
MTDDQVHSMLADVRRLADIEAIKDLKAKYFRYVDTQHWDGWRDEVFADDLRFESDGKVKEGSEAMVAFTEIRLRGGTSVHHGHTPEITITGPDTATGIWAMYDYVEMTTKDGTPMVLNGYGHYHERYVRTSAGWRIQGIVLTRLRVDIDLDDAG